MIARMWNAVAGAEGAAAYGEHFVATVLPGLKSVEGHRGAYLLHHHAGDLVEIQVVTLWDSLDAIRGFAGADIEAAVVEPEARAVLHSYADRVTHHEVVINTVD